MSLLGVGYVPDELLEDAVNHAVFSLDHVGVRARGYRTKTEFIRDAVRRRLEELGIKLIVKT